MSFRKTSLPSVSLSDRMQINVFDDRSGQRVSDDERRRHQEIRFDVLMNARLEIAVARQNRSGDQIVFDDLFFDARIERTGIADAGRAAVTDEIKTDFVRDISANPFFPDIPSRRANRARARF